MSGQRGWAQARLGERAPGRSAGSERFSRVTVTDDWMVTNPKAIPLAPKDYPEVAGVEVADEAVPETYPENYLDWVKAFQEFKAS